MQQIIETLKPLILECAKKVGVDVVDIEWVRENKMRILRILADKPEGLNIDDATTLNKAISDQLDEVDLIEEDYSLEVSSPGLERELKTIKDITRSIGKYICVRLYATQKGKKEVYGTLKSFDQDILSLECEDENNTMITIDRSQASKIRLAIKF